MKKILFLMASMVILVSLVAGCVSSAKAYIDPEETIKISNGKEFTIALDSNPTTGYNWEVSYDDTLLYLVNDEYKQDEKASGLVGAGGTQYYGFKALKAGNTKITLVYKRSWETEVLETKVFQIEIK